MELTPILKKHKYPLIGFAVLILIAAIAIAQTTSAPNPGHAADEIGEGTIANTLTLSEGNIGIGANKHIYLGSKPFVRLDNTNNIFFGTGTGGAYYFFGDAMVDYGNVNTGNLAVNGQAAISGNVGIGTMDPWQKLQLGGGSDANIYMDFVTDSRRWHMGVSQSGGDDKFVIQDYTAEATRFLIDTAGNVGIGTTIPDVKLAVVGDIKIPQGNHIFLGSKHFVRLDSTTNNVYFGTGTGLNYYFFGDAMSGYGNVNTGNLAVNGQAAISGNVGIGTANPNSKLQIGTPGAAGREYLQIDMESNAPASTDCDAQNEGGRMVYDDSNKRIWVCDGTGGWRYAQTTP